MSEPEKFETWGLVEVMGHSRYAGFITEQAIGGTSFVRVDVPAFAGVPGFTKLLGASSIFAITPTTEQIAKGMASKMRATPINVFDLPRTEHLALPGMDEESDYEDD